MSIRSQEYCKRLYIAEEVKSVYEGVTSRNYYDVCSVECEEVEEGFVLPLKKSIDDFGTSYFRGGVTDSCGVFVEMSRHWRGSKGGSLTEGYDFSLKDAEIVPKEVLYGGVFVNHFGHFLMESTNRLWYLIENKEKKSGHCLFERQEAEGYSPVLGIYGFVGDFPGKGSFYQPTDKV